MTQAAPRAAFFTDCFHEINGVAHTSRQFVRFAVAQNLPLLVVNAAAQDRAWTEGSVTHLEFRRRFPSLPLDVGMSFDLGFPRHFDAVAEALHSFRPDIVHLTGPGDAGLIGLILAHRFRLPVIASWHTNLHEYAASRMPAWLPARESISAWAESRSLALVGAFYRYARRTLAPNPELGDFLEKLTGKPVGLMERGVDTSLFHPANRVRECDEHFRIGYVGRLSREKNVRSLIDIQAALQTIAPGPFHFCIVGQGDERPHLERHLKGAFFRGVLHGNALARAYADFDALVFPSETDTYGNVVLEALASGVPALVSNSGGPKFLVRDAETGFICRQPADFAIALNALMRNPNRHAAMRAAARRSAMCRTWSSVCDAVYNNYQLTLQAPLAQDTAPCLTSRIATRTAISLPATSNSASPSNSTSRPLPHE